MRKLFLIICTTLLMGITQSSAQRLDTPSYAEPGPYAVGSTDIVIEDETRPLEATIWYPALINEEPHVTYSFSGIPLREGGAYLDAEPDLSGGPYPLVVFSHGNAGMRYQSTFLTEHLATQGFVVVAADHPTNTLADSLSGDIVQNIPPNFIYRPQDITRLIDYTLAANEDGDLAGLIDPEHIAVMGHSFGGYTALASGGARLNLAQLEQFCTNLTGDLAANVCFLTDHQPEMVEAAGLDAAPQGAWPTLADDRIDAVVALAPWNGLILDQTTLTQLDMPVMIMVGGTDSIALPDRDAVNIFSTLQTASSMMVTLENADHYIFVDTCYDQVLNGPFTAMYPMCSDPVWDMERAHDLIRHFTTAFLQSVLVDGQQTAALSQEDMDFPAVTVTRRNIGSAPVALMPDIVESYPHDTSAYTQGLLLYNDFLYESAGLYGESTLRKVEPDSGDVEQMIDMPEKYFAEGLARVDDRLYQITWKEETAFVYDIETFDVVETFSYDGEGWGLCYDGSDLYMSDGSDIIEKRDPETFEVLETIQITIQGQSVGEFNIQGQPASRLNELECVGDDIYANVYTTDIILRFNKSTGLVNGLANLAGLLPTEEASQLGSGEVLNGIAYDAERDLFYITGKHWPRMFEIRFTSVEQ